jgi:peptidoglycan LD-endopeptidase LytH
MLRVLWRLVAAILRLGVALIVIAASLSLAHWALADRLPPVLQHPVVAWRLVRADAPTHLPVPVAGVQRSALRDTWHAARPGDRLHEGIDIFAPRGREVLSTTPGIVVSLASTDLGGLVVRVLGPGGQWHYYAHLDRHGPIEPGQIVEAGALLGFVGNTGNARDTPPHLHYAIYAPAGGAINPYPLLAVSGQPPTGRGAGEGGPGATPP